MFDWLGVQIDGSTCGELWAAVQERATPVLRVEYDPMLVGLNVAGLAVDRTRRDWTEVLACWTEWFARG